MLFKALSEAPERPHYASGAIENSWPEIANPYTHARKAFQNAVWNPRISPTINWYNKDVRKDPRTHVAALKTTSDVAGSVGRAGVGGAIAGAYGALETIPKGVYDVLRQGRILVGDTASILPGSLEYARASFRSGMKSVYETADKGMYWGTGRGIFDGLTRRIKSQAKRSQVDVPENKGLLSWPRILNAKYRNAKAGDASLFVGLGDKLSYLSYGALQLLVKPQLHLAYLSVNGLLSGGIGIGKFTRSIVTAPFAAVENTLGAALYCLRRPFEKAAPAATSAVDTLTMQRQAQAMMEREEELIEQRNLALAA